MKQEHEMTPGVLVSGNDMSAGDYKARVAVLEAELAELRGRVCVPDASTMARVLSDRAASACCVDPDDNWKIYGQEFIEDVRAMLAASPAPVERCANCDGTGDVHRADGEWLGECTCSAAPVEPVKQAANVFWVLFDGTTDVKYIKKDSDAGTLAFFDNEEDAAWAKRFNPGTDYKRVEYYTTPQPAPNAAPSRDVIRATLTANGFTIKEGHTDLEPYVYEAVEALFTKGFRHEL